MSRLMRSREIAKRPVVTLDGEDVAQVKDVVYGGSGTVSGFTLNGRGLLSGPRKESLPWSAVVALGADAVMIAAESDLVAREQVVEAADASGRDVLRSRVLTDAGTDLGEVVDVVLEVDDQRAVVVGYEIDSTEAVGRGGTKVLIPLPDTLAVSGEALMVPQAATEFVTDDLAGFGAAVEGFRARLRADRPEGAA